MSETVVYTPENQANNMLPWMLAAGNGGGFGFGGMNGIIDLFGMGIIASMFGWNGNGGLGNNNGATEYISNQMNNNAGRELLMNAITSQGEASRTAVQGLSNMIGQDFNLVNSSVQNIQNGLNTLAIQEAVSVPQIINSIQSGDTALLAKLQDCCCQNKLLTTQLGYESQIATLNQTNQLGSQADRNANAIIGAINAQTVAMNDQFCAAKERDMQAEINRQGDLITQLRNQISNDKQTEAFTAAFNTLNSKVTELAAKVPNTVPVQWPALTAVNTTPYVNGGYYGSSFGFGNGINF